MSDSTAASADAAAETAPAAWPAVVSLSLGVFALVTAEFLPASILTPMATDLGISNGLAGQAVTATAVVGAIAGPAIVVGTSQYDRRLILWGLTALLIVSNALAALASNLPMLLFSRILLGISLGGFWAMSAALAMRLVPYALMPRAMAIIFTGVSLATVCAAPVGAWIGDRWGWRVAFIVADVVAVVAFAAQLITVPRLPPADKATFSTFLLVLRRPRVQSVLIIIALVVSGALRRLHLCPPVPGTGAAHGCGHDFAGAARLWHWRLLRQSGRRLPGRAQRAHRRRLRRRG